ncbi:hypothetical protein [Sphingomonas sp. TZW2008]|uniref:hypothetical protein n=1 Tax=Sphingomonas sp. TZW2008 TaxID=1917973 RepID=UPI000A26798B|nr:hypothetical protein [Sphingomonas sp. TZW2008]
MSKVDLGLGNLDDITPSAPSSSSRRREDVREERAAIDAVGREHGFTKPSQPPLKLGRRKNPHAGEPMHQISMKGPASVMSRFIELCDRENAPYWQVIENLMDRTEEK